MDTTHVYNLSSGSSTGEKCIQLGGVILTIVSSTASIIGSLLVICTFLRWKDLRTIARMIVVFLAIADLFTGIGYIFGSGIYLHYYIITGVCPDDNVTTNTTAYPQNDSTYLTLCKAQSFLTTFMPMASFFWTANLAIYLFFAIALQKINFAKMLMILFHLTAWGIPFVTCLAILSADDFGPSTLSSGAWCWIYYKSSLSHTSYLIIELMAGKVWEILVCVLALVLYIAIKVIVWKRNKHPKADTEESEFSSINMRRQVQAAFIKVDQKLIWLPIVFLLLRVWGNIRFFMSIDGSSTLVYNNILVYLQSICDPGQGWSNALFFVIFNHKISQRLCPCIYTCGNLCIRAISRALYKKRVRHKRIWVKKNEGPTERDPLLFTDSLKSTVSDISVLYSTNRSRTTLTKSSSSKTSSAFPEDEEIFIPDDISINSHISQSTTFEHQ